jgi:predicted transcriptional regulator
MSDTPETDKEERMAFSQEYMVPTDFARRLERERDEARNMVEKLTEQGLAMMDENRSLKREIKKLKKSSNHKL